MPRVDATVSCTGSSKIDTNRIKSAIAELIRSITGQSCQVVVTTTGGGGVSDKVNAYKMRQSVPGNNIDLYPR